MPRNPRFFPPAGLIEITSRTVQGRFLLTPRPEICEIILGVLGRAQHLAPVKIHAFSWLSNHVHLLVTPANPQQLSRFCSHLFGNVARRVGLEVDWQTKFWSRRYDARFVTAEEAAQTTRLRYLLAQGCKEGLVMSPLDWPGPSSTSALVDGSMQVDATWVDRTKVYRAHRQKHPVPQSDLEQQFPVRLSPLPCWEHLEPAKVSELVLEMVEDIEAVTACKHLREKTKPLGARKVLRRPPHFRPSKLATSLAPACHAVSRSAFEGFWTLFREFVAAYREAAAKLKEGFLDVEFPPGAFPPPRPIRAPNTS